MLFLYPSPASEILLLQITGHALRMGECERVEVGMWEAVEGRIWGWDWEDVKWYVEGMA